MADAEFQNLKQRSLYAKLKKLFSTDVIVRNIGGKQLKVVDTDEAMYATDRNTLRDRFNRIRTSAYNQYSRDFSLSYQASRTELFRDYDCIGPDTIIPLPDGSRPTIKELTEKYDGFPRKKFYVFSYDLETDSIKLGKAYHPRKKGHRLECWKVIFENGQYVMGSEKHPFLMRNGEYKMIKDLKIGESVMPFYQKDFYNSGYRSLYNFSKGWNSEHTIIAEQFDRPLNDNEVVHHKNFDKTNNLPENLQIMTDTEHRAYHMNLNNNIIWSSENKQKTISKIQSSEGYKNRKCHKWNGERKGENNPFYGKIHTDESNRTRSETLKDVFADRDQSGENNPNYRDDLTIDVLKIKATDYYKENGKLTLEGLIENIGCDYATFQCRLKYANCDWDTFKKDIVSTLNHKIKAIEYIGEMDVYDLTVEKYHNFATDSCFVRNTMDMDPIIASALDIYADECITKNELGNILTVHSENGNIKQILENLFYDILNIEFNMWSWTRNLVKYGDFYLKLQISPEYGVYMVEPMSAYNVTRVENSDLNNKSYVKFQINLPEGGKIENLENYNVAHFRLLSDSNFLPYGKCLVGETHVDTEFGSKYIKDLLIGEKIWSFNTNSGIFELTSVKNKINSGVKETIKIRTQHNFIESSKNHPILTFNKNTNKLEYKQTSDVKIGDLLAINANENKKSKISRVNTDLVGFNKNGWKNNIVNLPNDIDCEFSELIGFLIGDGWLSGENTRVSFAIGKDDIQNKHYASILEKYSGKIGNWMAPRKNSGGQFYVDSKMLATVLFNNGLIGKAKTKRIPTWVFESSEDIQLAFIKGLTNADAWSFDDEFANRYTISLCNKDLIYDFKRLLQFNNIKSSIPTEDDTISEVTICGVDCIKHGEYSINYYLDGNKKQQLEKYNHLDNSDILLEPVVNIEFTGEKETWDIQVDSENSNFVANGIIVHNSMIENGRRVWKQLCLHKNTEIWTDYGYKTIENIKNGDTVYSYDYNNCQLVSTKVKNWAKTGIKDTYLVKTKHRTLQLTDSHDVLVIDNNKNYHYKKVKDLLQDGNYSLVLPTINSNKNSHIVKLDSEEYNVSLNEMGIEYVRQKLNKDGIINKIKDVIGNVHSYKLVHAFLMGTRPIPYNVFILIQSQFGIDDRFIQLNINKSKNSSIVNNNFEFEFDSNMIRFLGFILGDGWVTKNGVGFALSHHEDINKRYIDIIKSLKLSYCISYPKNNPTHPGSVIVSNKEFKLLLESAGFITGFKNKIIPEWIFQLSINSKKEFIKGLFDADGSWKWGVIGLSNKELITQLKHLCQQSGIMCNEVKTCREQEETDEYGVNRQPSYKLYINFNEEYTLTFEKIISIKLYEKDSEVYDIQVDSDLHNFVANGSVVHNSLMEDAMLIHRIMRAPEKRIFKIDVGNLPPQEIDAFVAKQTALMQKIPYIDEKTGDYNLRFNIQNMVEDFILPVRGNDSGTSIEPLNGMEFTGIDDIEYLRNKLMAALKIPKAFLTYEEDLSGKATLAQEDVRFAKTILRIQRILVSELTKIAIVHLYAQGYKDAALVNFDLELTNPSVVFEKEKITMWGEKVNVAKDMLEQKLFSKTWIYDKIFHLSEDDTAIISGDIVEDSKQLYRFKQIEEEGNDPAKPFNKINPSGEDSGSDTGGNTGGGDTGAETGGPETGSGEPRAAAIGPETGGGGSTEAPLAEKVKTPYKRPSQAGKKKASDYPFGEDEIGKLSFSTVNKTDPLRHVYKNKSSFRLEGLGAFMSSLDDDKKALLKENVKTEGLLSSYMDENNLTT